MGDKARQLILLSRVLPEVFGNTQTASNTLSKLFALCEGHPDIIQIGKGDKVKIKIRSNEFSRLGLPFEEITFTLDHYTKNLWSFTFVAQTIKKYKLILEWNSDINQMAPEAFQINCSFQYNGPLQQPFRRNFRIENRSSDDLTSISHTELTRTDQDQSKNNFLTKLKYQKKGNTLLIQIILRPQEQKPMRINLNLPIRIRFHPR